MSNSVRLGLLRLADSAPAVLAEAEGLFIAEGLDVRLLVEPSWANVADKLAWGMLDAAVMLPPLVLAMAGGLRGKRTGLILPMGISRGGNSVAVQPGAAETIAAQGVASWVRGCPAPPRLAVVHVFSTHNLLLRAWLAASGVDPDREVEIVVVPPEQVVAELAAERVAGFCAGAPWGAVAAQAGVGRVVSGSSAIRPGHAEKGLVLQADFAAARPHATAALMRALDRAQRLCAEPERAPALAALLAARLGLPELAVRMALPGGGASEAIGFAGAAEVSPEDGVWFLEQMRHWGWLAPATDIGALAAAVYRKVAPAP